MVEDLFLVLESAVDAPRSMSPHLCRLIELDKEAPEGLVPYRGSRDFNYRSVNGLGGVLNLKGVFAYSYPFSYQGL